jgi:2-polyprenyl-3-methyl-5-hydroxy-6-metoxy-1,4-benzoquinol methylase
MMISFDNPANFGIGFAPSTGGNFMDNTAKNIDSTIEFFIPTLGPEIEPYLERNDISGVHHLARYHWAVRVLSDLRPRRIIDIACGAGYGTAMIARACPQASILGVDYDERAVAHARRAASTTNLSFSQGNMITWRDGGGQRLGEFDAIISFDTIEHLEHRDIALLQLSRNLKAGGILLLSTPCGHDVTILNPAWEHHKAEYSHSDLRELLSKFFRQVLTPDHNHDDFPGVAFWDALNREKTIYLNRGNPIVCHA